MDNNTINRQAAIAYAISGLTREFEGEKWIRVSEVRESLQTMPSAERRGRWIKDKNLYKCTACNDLLSVAGWADCIPEKQIYTAFKYCPNCGAKMDEVLT